MKKYLFISTLCIMTTVMMWNNLNAQETPQTNPCIDCHSAETPRIVKQWEKSKHSLNGVVCQVCHLAGVGDKNAIEHNGFSITKNLSITYCEGCHALAYDVMEASRYRNGSYSHAPLK